MNEPKLLKYLQGAKHPEACFTLISFNSLQN